jgi:hypothetical protein
LNDTLTDGEALHVKMRSSSEPANAVDVEYTLTFAETGRDRANGTGTLIVNEPTPINSFSENSYGDLVSLTANIGGRAYIFASNTPISIQR